MSTKEIRHITGKRNRNAQCRVLREKGYNFVPRPDGSPVVLRGSMPRGTTNCDGDLLSELEIVARAAPITKTCAIYFLILGSSIIYIGRTNNLHKRLGEHMADPGKNFDAYHYIRVPETKAQYVEEAYIRAFLPRFNIQHNLKKCAT